MPIVIHSMNHLAPLFLLPLVLTLSSCNLAGKLIQAPVRLIQAGARTVSDAQSATPPATAEAHRQHGIALQASEQFVK